MADPARILREQRPIDAELMIERRDGARIGERAEDRAADVARQKLAAQRPRSLAAASRIPGVSPADVAVLMVYLDKLRRTPARD